MIKVISRLSLLLLAALGTPTLHAHGDASIEGPTGYLNAGSDGVVQIMPLGDGITSGEGSGSYREVLEDSLQYSGIPFDFVGSQSSSGGDLDDTDHEGISGATLEELTALIRNQNLLAGEIDIILLLAGAEDISPNAASSVSDRDMETRFANLLSAVREKQPNAKVVVSTLLPTGLQVSPSLVATNAALKRAARDQNDGNLFVADGSVALESGDISGDGVIPTSVGYSKLADMFYGAVQALYWPVEEFYEGTASLGDGWRFSEVFGSFSDRGDIAPGWKFMETLGWVYTAPGDAPELYLYEPALGWFFTNHENYPNLYLFDRGGWVWHEFEDGRSIYDYAKGAYETF